MAVYLVSYDIPDKNPEDYQPLWDLLEKFGAKRVLYSQWVLTSSVEAQKLFDQIREVLHEGDGLLLLEIIRTRLNWQNLRASDTVFRAMVHDARSS